MLLFTIIFLGEVSVNWLVFAVKIKNSTVADYIFWAKYALLLSLLTAFLIIDRKTLSDIGFRKPVNHITYTTGIVLFLIWAAALWQRYDLSLATFLIIVLREPIFEEILFRGFFQTNLQRSLGANKNFWLAVILFTAFHIPNIFWGWQAKYEVPSMSEKTIRLAADFFMSTFLCMIYRKTRSLYPLFAIHFAANNHLANLWYLFFR